MSPDGRTVVAFCGHRWNRHGAWPEDVDPGPKTPHCPLCWPDGDYYIVGVACTPELYTRAQKAGRSASNWPVAPRRHSLDYERRPRPRTRQYARWLTAQAQLIAEALAYLSDFATTGKAVDGAYSADQLTDTAASDQDRSTS